MAGAMLLSSAGVIALAVIGVNGYFTLPLIASVPSFIPILLVAYELSVDLQHAQHVSEALEQSQGRIILAAKAANLGIWEWDIPSDTIWATEAGRARVGAEDSERIGFNRFLRFVHPEDRQRTRQAIYHSIESKDEFEIEYRMNTMNMGIRWMTTKGNVERNFDGKPLRVRGVSIDITERKQAEVALRQAQAQVG